MNVQYTKEFYAQVEKMMMKHPHKCWECGLSDGERKYNKDGTRQRFAVVVRLAYVDIFGPKAIASNVGLYCTKCRKPGDEWRTTPRRIKPSRLPQLF